MTAGPRGKRPLRERLTGVEASESAIALAFCLPALALLAVFVIWPFVYGLWLSFHRWDGFGTPRWTGFDM